MEILKYIINTPLSKDIIFYFLLSLIPLVIIIWGISQIINNLKQRRKQKGDSA